MLYSSILTLGLLAGACVAAPGHSFVQHERREVDIETGQQWIKRSRAPAEATMPVRIALKQRNLERGHDLLMDISDPHSANFGKHLSPQEIGELFEPHHDSIANIRTWLIDEGIHPDRHTLSAGKGWIKFEASVAEIESLLRTEYHVFEHPETGEDHIAADTYHLPEHVHPHVDFITPTIAYRPLTKRVVESRASSFTPVGALPPPQNQPFTPPKSMTSDSGDLSHCYAFVTPACIRAMYGITVSTTAAEGNELGIFETFYQYDQQDLDYFFNAFTARVPNGTHPIQDSIDGGQGVAPNVTGGGDEPLLDFEISIPIIYPQKTILYQVDDLNRSETAQGFGDTFLDGLDKSFCTYMGGDNKTIDPIYPDPSPGGYNHPEQCGAYKPTNVISVSYGLAEFSYTRFYELRQCNEYMKLALAGTTTFYSSGDSGVASRQGCLGNKTAPKFAPQFPAACPYVTAVGATQIPYGQPVTAVQEAVSDPAAAYYSGGGFSNYWATPSYQQAAVNTFLTQHAPPYPAGTFNKSGRGYPDVSAVGINIVVYTEGQPLLQGGTSASAPLWAAIVTTINEKRITAGKGPVGFINPTLYKNPQVFQDITSGSNPGCGLGGFNATQGWDPVTGLGTPKFTELEKVLVALP